MSDKPTAVTNVPIGIINGGSPREQAAHDLVQELHALRSELSQRTEELQRTKWELDERRRLNEDAITNMKAATAEMQKAIERAELAEAKVAAMAERLQLIESISRDRITASEFYDDVCPIVRETLVNLPDRAKRLMELVEASIAWEQAEATLKGLVPASIHLEEAVRAYRDTP